MEEPVSFGTTDYVIMIVMLLISLAIGFYFAIIGRKQHSQEEYLLGGRKMGVIPVALSLFATYNSAVSLLGIPADVYSYGTMYFYLALSLGLANLITIYTVLPLIYPLKVTSIYEYLHLRFDSKGVRTLGAALGMFQTMCYMTIALLSPALALQTAASLPLWMSLVTVGAVGTVYTAIGGMKSVVWTDAFQSAIIFGGILATFIKGSVDVGGFGNVWTTTEERGRLIFDDVSLDPRVRHTIWGGLIACTINWVTTFFGQAFTQRLCATKSLDHARRVILIVTPLNVVYCLILVATGMTILAYFDYISCDPLAAGYVSNANQLMPYFVIRTFGFIPGLSGLYISTIFSGALSTLSSGINSLAANTVEDILHPVLRNFRESTVTAFSKAIVLLYGVMTIVLAYLIKEVQGPMTQITTTIMGASGGPIMAMFLLGAIFPQGNKAGASIGCLVGLAFCIWLNIAKFNSGARNPTLPLGPTINCQNPSSANAGLNETSLAETFHSGNAFNFNQSLDVTGETTVASLVSSTSATDSKISDDSFHLQDISYVWVPVLGCLISLIAGLIISRVYELITGIKKRPKPQYLFPFMRKVWYQDYELETKKDGDMEEEIEMLDRKI